MRAETTKTAPQMYKNKITKPNYPMQKSDTRQGSFTDVTTTAAYFFHFSPNAFNSPRILWSCKPAREFIPLKTRIIKAKLQEWDLNISVCRKERTKARERV